MPQEREETSGVDSGLEDGRGSLAIVHLRSGGAGLSTAGYLGNSRIVFRSDFRGPNQEANKPRRTKSLFSYYIVKSANMKYLSAI